MDNKILAQVVRKNSKDYLGGKLDSINSGLGTYVQGVYWRVCYYSKNGFIENVQFLNASQPKPTSDSVKTIKLYDTITNNSYYVVIADNAGVNTWNNLSNSAAGSLNLAMPFVVIPSLIAEVPGTVDTVNTDYIYQTNADVLGANQVLLIAVTALGNPIGTFSAAGYTSVAAVVAALTAQLGNAGQNVFTNPGGAQLVKWAADFTTGYKTASLSVAKANYLDSAVAPAAGANGFYLSVTADGVAYPNQVKALTLAALVAAANSDVYLASLGVYSLVNANTQVRLVRPNGTVTAITVTAAA